MDFKQARVMCGIGFIIVFISGWLIVGLVLRHIAGFTYGALKNVDPGERLFVCRFASGSVNSVGCQRCVTILAYEGGILIRNWPLFLGGSIWLPRQQMRWGEIRRGLFGSQSVELNTDAHKIWFLGRNAQRLRETYADD